MKKTLLSLFFCFIATSLIGEIGYFVGEHPTVVAESQFFHKYAASLEKTDLKYLHQTTYSGEKISDFGAHIMSRKYQKIEEGRLVFLKALDAFLTLSNNDAKLKTLFDPYPMTGSRLNFVLTYWGTDMERPAKPYLAEIALKDGVIEYRYKKKKSEHFSTKVVRETVEAARNKLKPSL